MKTREMDVRKFKKELKDKGFIFDRTKGGHEIWKSAEGKSFAVPTHGKSVKSGIVWQFLRECDC